MLVIVTFQQIGQDGVGLFLGFDEGLAHPHLILDAGHGLIGGQSLPVRVMERLRALLVIVLVGAVLQVGAQDFVRLREIIGAFKLDVVDLDAVGQAVIGLVFGEVIAQFGVRGRGLGVVVGGGEVDPLGNHWLVFAAVEEFGFLGGDQFARHADDG